MPKPRRRRARNGQGSVYRDGDGWRAAVRMDGTVVVRRAKTEVEAETLKRELLRLRDAGQAPTDERLTVAAYLSDWLESMRSRLRARVWTRYEQYCRLHAMPSIGGTRLAKLTGRDLDKLYAARLAAGSSPQTVHHLHAVLHRAFAQAVRWGLLGRNPADLVDPPSVPRHEPQTLNVDQVQQLLAAATGTRLEALLTLAVTTGMREGELLALRWQDIGPGLVHITATLDPVSRQRTEPKTQGSRRMLRLSERASEALERHHQRQREERLHAGPNWQDDDLVFPNLWGKPTNPANLLRREFYPLLEAAGLPRIRFHDLRHTAATLLMANGLHPRIISDLLGHSQIGVTMDRYSHVSGSVQAQAAALMDALLPADTELHTTAERRR